jgi:hypothetical protein
MMTGGSSSEYQLSAQGIDMIAGVQIKRLPTGEALGARDLERWSSNRSAGRSGAFTTKNERKTLSDWNTPLSHEAKHTTHQAAAARGILVEQTSRDWFVSLPDGSRKGPFKNAKDAWSWVDRRLDKRNPSVLSAGASQHHHEGTPGQKAD